MEEYLVHIAREGLYLVLVLAAAPVLASLLAGLIVSMLQTATQVQEQTLTLVPKILAVAIALLLAGPWIGAQLIHFATLLFEGIAKVSL